MTLTYHLDDHDSKFVEWCKQHYKKPVASEYLVMTATNGNKCYFKPSDESIKSNIKYVDDRKKVQFPYNLSSDISAFNTVANVDDQSQQISSIDSCAFCLCTNLTSVNCPNVLSIGYYAFMRCSNLSAVDFQKATSIGYGAFQTCTKLQIAECPNVLSLNNDTFNNCGLLTSVNIQNATSIGSLAFMRCTKLISINCQNASSILFGAFIDCSSLSTLNCPNVISIYENAFDNCDSLESIVLSNMTDDHITSVDISAFTQKSYPISVYVPQGFTSKMLATSNWAALTANNTIDIVEI